MVLKKAAMGVQMDRDAILQGKAEQAPAPEPEAAAQPVLDIRQQSAPLRQAQSPGLAPTKRAAKPRTAPAAATPAEPNSAQPGPAGGVGVSVTVLLTEEQWQWVLAEAKRRGIAQRYVLLSAVDRHRDAIAEHFRTTVHEGANLFRWTGEPKDVEGKKIGRPLRIPAGEREILQQLVDEVGAPSLSMYLRIAAEQQMVEQSLE